MIFSEFTTTTYAKWILSGEHAVLRHHPALVFPIPEKKLTIHYEPKADTLDASFSGISGQDIHLLFWSVLEQGQQLLNQSLNKLTGHFHLHCDIQVGSGLGASAALCVAMARWFHAQGLGVSSVYTFAKQLEDLFHGQSSGLDIAGVSSEEGIHFQQGVIKPLNLAWQPQWYLSSSGQVGITAHCVQQVAELWKVNPAKAKMIDEAMHQSVNEAMQALSVPYSKESFTKLKEAIQLGHQCFKDWDLISENLASHMQYLTKLGAAAVKPTGSGVGGYVLSLWETPPNPSLCEERSDEAIQWLKA